MEITTETTTEDVDAMSIVELVLASSHIETNGLDDVPLQRVFQMARTLWKLHDRLHKTIDMLQEHMGLRVR